MPRPGNGPGRSPARGADVTVSTDVLDKIDEIVPPGSTISHADQGYAAPALTDPFPRRRRTS
ncbi:hypothetical protein [Mycobacterium sp.]|uniref:hypothetical protein n=1 Tax=Mycobacterium sp. TaxID=1785 RepID=UPI0028BD7382|nr:hypothetical protein [Mycobacterium sp.]